jgi:prepilin-type N-terminal cleavage/methylation domain-containing protein/prepilin-type processing-associated H-X9-DG protein
MRIRSSRRPTSGLPRRSLSSARSSGFTLVELLVVIGIIAVLTAILLPAIGRARKSASDLVCLANLRSIGHSALLYANEWRGVLPTNGTALSVVPAETNRSHYWLSSTAWFEKLNIWKAYGRGFAPGASPGTSYDYGNVARTGFIRTVYQCPLTRSLVQDEVRRGGKDFTYDYSLNHRLGGEYSGRSPRIPTTKHLRAQRWWFADAGFYYNSGAAFQYYPKNAVPIEDYGSSGGVFEGPWMFAGFDRGTSTWWWSNDLPSHGNSGKRNDKGINVLFGDGHAARVTAAEVRALRATRSGGKSVVLWEWSGNTELRPPGTR